MTKKHFFFFCFYITSLVCCTQFQKPPELIQAPGGSITPAKTVQMKPVSNTVVPSLTPVETQFVQKSETIEPKFTSVSSTLQVINTPTITPAVSFDSEVYPIRIVGLGSMSKVISPVELIVHIAPEYTGTTRIELIGEDGAELFRKILKTYSNIGYYTRVVENIDFEIQGVAEIARLQISSFDEKGQMQALNSVRLLLQSIGDNEINLADDLSERTLIHSPRTGDEITGGLLTIEAEFKPINSLPVIVEIISDSGTVIGSRMLKFESVKGGYEKISTSIPYKVETTTEARLIIRQSDDRIDGLAYFFSEKLKLAP